MASSSSADRAGITPYLLFLVAITTLGPLQFGYHLAELNAPEAALRCRQPKPPSFVDYFKSTPKAQDVTFPICIPMEPSEFGLVSSIYTLGGFIGALSAGPLSSRKGRLFPMRITGPFFIFGSLLAALAPSFTALAIGRFLSGLGSGAAMVVGPVYVSEIAPTHLKGTLGATTQIAINFGILGTQILGYFLSYDSMWRVVLGTASGIGVVHFLGLLFLVESPEWLGAKGQTAGARKSLLKIRSGNLVGDEVGKWASGQDDDERQSLLSSGSSSSQNPTKNATIGIWSVIRHPDHYRAIQAVVAVMLAQQLCGINSVMMYSVSFLSDLLPTGAGPITVAVGALNVVVTIACSPLSDILGRKPCLLLSIAGMGANALLLGIGIMYSFKVLSAVATLLFVASFALGLGPVPFILASELVGPEAVGATQSIALGANWGATFLVAQFFPMLNAGLGKGRVFFLFAALAACFFFIISWRVPESKGKKDADEVWGRVRRVD